MLKKSNLPILVIATSVLCLSLVFIATAADKGKTLDTDPHLVGWWKFDETAGKTAADSSRHKRKGKLTGEMSFEKNSAEGKIGKALKLGERDYVEITKYKGITGTKPRTITAWVKTTKRNGEIVSWGLDDFGKMWICRFIRGRIGVTPQGGYFYMKEGVSDDKWHHVAAVVHEAELPNLHDDVKLYRDGELAIIDDIGLLDLWPIDTGKDIDVRIGRGYTGLIDDLRLYDRALNEDEIKAIYELKSNQPLGKAK